MIFLQHLYHPFVNARYFVEGLIEGDAYSKKNIKGSELHTPIKVPGT